jgi:hypothetical protein
MVEIMQIMTDAGPGSTIVVRIIYLTSAEAIEFQYVFYLAKRHVNTQRPEITLYVFQQQAPEQLL